MVRPARRSLGCGDVRQEAQTVWVSLVKDAWSNNSRERLKLNQHQSSGEPVHEPSRCHHSAVVVTKSDSRDACRKRAVCEGVPDAPDIVGLQQLPHTPATGVSSPAAFSNQIGENSFARNSSAVCNDCVR